MTKTWFVGGRHHVNTVRENAYERRNPKTNRIVKIIKGICSSCGRNESQFSTK